MPEIYEYTAPEYAAPPANSVELVGIQLFRRPQFSAHFRLIDDTGRTWEISYMDSEDAEGNPTTEARDIVRGLNKANMSTKSMEKRVLEKLIADGYLSAGTITGSPD